MKGDRTPNTQLDAGKHVSLKQSWGLSHQFQPELFLWHFPWGGPAFCPLAQGKCCKIDVLFRRHRSNGMTGEVNDSRAVLLLNT